MPETLTLPPPTEVSPSAEPTQSNPDYLCRAFNLYMAAQSVLMSKQTGLSRQEFSPEHLSKLEFSELLALKGRVDGYWASPTDSALADSFSERSHIGSQEITIDDPMARQEIVELAHAGVACAMVKHIKDRSQELLDKISKAQGGAIDRSRLRDLRHGLIEESKHTTADAIDFNHHARDLMESQWAKKHHLGRHQLYQLIAVALQGDRAEARQLESGISVEIALCRSLDKITTNRNRHDGGDRNVRYGDAQEDARGGDIVLTQSDTKFYIDSKSRDPDPETRNSAQQAGFEITRAGADKNGYDYKVTLWSSGHEAVGEHFETDSALSAQLVRLLDEAENLVKR